MCSGNCCKQGQRGPQGPAGQRGPIGPQGPAGPPGGIRYFSIPTHNGQTLDYIQRGSSDQYHSVARFVFPGTTTFGTPTRVIANVWGIGSKIKQCRIFDLTNNVEVARNTTISSNNPANIADLNEIVMVWPASPAVMIVQMKSDIGEEWCIGSVTVEH